MSFGFQKRDRKPECLRETDVRLPYVGKYYVVFTVRHLTKYIDSLKNIYQILVESILFQNNFDYILETSRTFFGDFCTSLHSLLKNSQFLTDRGRGLVKPGETLSR